MNNICDILKKTKAYIETEDGDILFCGISKKQFPDIFLTLEILANEANKKLDDFAVDVYFYFFGKENQLVGHFKEIEEAAAIVEGFWLWR